MTLAAAAPAQAHKRALAPPGNSAIGQYVEVIPTAAGGRPTGSIHRGEGAGGSAGGALSSSTARSLSARGADGAAVANLVRQTAAGGSRGSHVARRPLSTGGAASAAATILRAVSGSSQSGGLGVLLPILLGVAFLGTGLLALRRRRAS